jgi:NADH-quinone oxidoreductase subunit M
MTNGVPWVSILGGLPILGMIALAFVPKRDGGRAKLVALVTSVVVFAGAVAMSIMFSAGAAARFQFVQHYSWISAFGAHYGVGVDGIGMVLIDLTALLVPVVILASWHDVELAGRSVRNFLALVLAVEALVIGMFGSTDLFLFYVLFEASLVPMYFVIGSYGGPRRSYAAVKFLLYSLAGGLAMLASVIGLYVAGAHYLPHGASFDFAALTQLTGHLSPTIRNLLFAGFFLAFAIKAPIWPFHTWLPDAATEAPTGGTVLLVAVLDKVGTFGLLRWTLPIFPKASHAWAPYILGLCVVGILYGALLAIGQRDLKRLFAYVSIAHFGFIGLGIFAFTTQGQSGATLYMVNHGLSTAALFLIVGFLASRRGSRLIEHFGGVASVAPWLAGTFLVAGLAALSLPGLGTFVSEFLVLVGTFTSNRSFAIAGTTGIIFAAIYILLMYQRTMHGPPREEVHAFRDLNLREAWAIAPLLVALLFLGFYPKPLLDDINPAVKATMHQLHSHDPAPSIGRYSPTSPNRQAVSDGGGQ